MAFAPKPKKVFDEARLYEYAVGSLSRKMRTVAELKRLLRQRATNDEAGRQMVEDVVTRLKDQKYLNDSQYAAAYSNYRRENEKFGKRRVITDLKTKGVHGDIIERAVATAYDDVNEEQLARSFLSRKRLNKPKTEREAAKVFRTMLRAGFASRTIFSILKKWDVADETLSALESEADSI
jgi:regulatory protein